METVTHEKPHYVAPLDHNPHDSLSLNSSELVAEIENLRSIVEELGERREEDRRSILILQSQIDHMRGYKCSDSLETSFKNVYEIANVLWNQLPSIPLRSLLLSSKKKGKKSKHSASCSKTTSCNSSVKFSSSRKVQVPFKVAKLGGDYDEIRVLSYSR